MLLARLTGIRTCGLESLTEWMTVAKDAKYHDRDHPQFKEDSLIENNRLDLLSTPLSLCSTHPHPSCTFDFPSVSYHARLTVASVDLELDADLTFIVLSVRDQMNIGRF